MKKYIQLIFFIAMLIMIMIASFISIENADVWEINGALDFLSLLVVSGPIIVLLSSIIFIQLIIKIICIILQIIAVCIKKEKAKNTLSRISININLFISSLLCIIYMFNAFYISTLINSECLFLVSVVQVIDIFISSFIAIKLNKLKVSPKFDLYNLD